MPPLGTAISLLIVLCHTAAASSEPCTDGNGQQVFWLDEANDTNVVQVGDTRFLRSSQSIIGAQFTSDDMKDATVFTAFVVMEAVCTMPQFTASKGYTFLQVGMGIGAVPAHIARQCDTFSRTDVVEYNKHVAQFATQHFGYSAGEIIIADGREFYLRQETSKYNVVSQDVFVGWNPSHMMSVDIFTRIHDHWLTPSTGVFMLNFVGYLHAENRVGFSKAVIATLRSVFSNVKCFSDVPPADTMENNDPTNIVCYSSDSPIKFHVESEPTDAPEFSMPWILNHFQEWEVFPQLDLHCDISQEQPTILNSEQDFAQFQDTIESLEQDIWKQVRPLLPDCAWNTTSLK